ncbi:MAG: phage antirepressor KilAC domain-containing protein [Paraclostridium sp.]
MGKRKETRASKKLYTATELAKELGISSPQKLNKLLSMVQFQYKVNNTWVTYAKYTDMGLVKLYEDVNGIYTREFTPAGRDYVKKLIEQVRGNL